jgi:hypothetical protein
VAKLVEKNVKNLEAATCKIAACLYRQAATRDQRATAAQPVVAGLGQPAVADHLYAGAQKM